MENTAESMVESKKEMGCVVLILAPTVDGRDAQKKVLSVAVEKLENGERYVARVKQLRALYKTNKMDTKQSLNSEDVSI